MATEQNTTLDFETLGLYIGRPADKLPEAHYSQYLNMEAYRSGYIQPRKGSIEIGTEQSIAPVQFAAEVHSMGFLLQEPAGAPTHVYFGAGTELYYRTGTNVPSQLQVSDNLHFSGNPMTMDNYKIADSIKIQAIAFDVNKRVKLDGATITSFGIAGAVKKPAAATNGGGNLSGDYQWAFQYRNRNTGSVSPLSPEMTALTTASNKVNLTIPQSPDSQVTDIDIYRTGGTIEGSFLFVKTVDNTAFGAPLTVEDDVADETLGSEVAVTQIEFSNPVMGPTTIRKTVNAGSAYTDYTAAAGDNSITTHVDIGALSTFANGDWLVIGADLQFRKILIGIDSVSGLPTANVNTNVSALTIEYWDGANWIQAADLRDGTSNGGRTFNVNGIITFRFPDNWEKNTIDGVEAYHVRLSVSAALSAAVLFDLVSVSAMPMDPDTFAIHGDRVWVNDLSNVDRLWYSERFRVEEFRLDNFVIITQSGDRVRRMLSLDDRMFIATDNTMYMMVGTGPDSFQPLPLGSIHGLFARYAFTRGEGTIFWRSYDGIYRLSGTGSEKISENMNSLFQGVAGGPEANLEPAYNEFNQLDHERMTYFDNKLYWSYKGANTLTRRELIFDLIANRWSQTDRQVTTYLAVPYQGKLFSSHTDLYVYRRDVGNVDKLGTTESVINFSFRAGHFDFGTPEQDKNFVELVFDVDPGGASFDMTLDFNNGDYTTTYPVAGTGRQLVNMPISNGIGIFSKNVGFRVTTDNEGKSIKFYKVTFNYWTEPRELNKTSWDWNDYGSPERKYFKQLVMDLDTQGTVCSVSVYLDGATVPTTTFTAVKTTTRQRTVLSLPIDTEGKLAKVQVQSAEALYEVKVYGHYFNFLLNGIEVGKTQTDWVDRGWPAEKRFRQLMVDINTFGQDVQCGVEIDGVTVETFTINTAGRRLVTHSLPANTVGKLERLVFNR